MGLLERSMESRIESSGPSLAFLRGLVALAESQGEEVLKEIRLSLPRKTYEQMVHSGVFRPHPRGGGDRRKGDRRSGERRGG